MPFALFCSRQIHGNDYECTFSTIRIIGWNGSSAILNMGFLFKNDGHSVARHYWLASIQCFQFHFSVDFSRLLCHHICLGFSSLCKLIAISFRTVLSLTLTSKCVFFFVALYQPHLMVGFSDYKVWRWLEFARKKSDHLFIFNSIEVHTSLCENFHF